MTRGRTHRQVESDVDAPWTLQPQQAADDRHRVHVWKGLTPPHLPRLRGPKLVGRRIEVWWDGDGRFFGATVEAYSTRAKEHGIDCDAGRIIWNDPSYE